ncbi:MAG: endopeptidase La [Acidobacteria bacterium]|nr:MAG: endopeptidase La [Acidobacteriota bacterium]PYQ84712.1 MAG: endopeptidase La [Acidobacteriota bacterium]PYQ85043.1 MAG: endopeptidase La [Acidobacteriota bacterium]PYR10840.1 MAG: endopeptidase La [Acidobacteriota bacterium]
MPTDPARTYPSELPVIALRQNVVLPLTLQPLAINRPASVDSVNRALSGDRLLFLVLQNNDDDEPAIDNLRRVGTIGAIRQMAKIPNGGMSIIVEGLTRAKAESYSKTAPSLTAIVSPAPDSFVRSLEVDAYVRRLQDLIDRALSLASGLSQELRGLVAGIDDPLRLVYLLSSLLDMRAEEKQQILETDDLLPKLQAVAGAMNREIALLEMKSKIESAAQQEMTDAQREYYLRQQLKAIQAELGEGEKTDIQEIRRRLIDAKLPETVARSAEREVDRLERMTPASPEYQMLRTYIDWVLDVPWSVLTEDRLDPIAARAVLDEDHYDLGKVKERIIEYLAVQKLKRAAAPAATIKGPILCFVGPPGVGKTSLGQSIARAMNRKFVRISLGGVRDEAEIRGHRRTYIGAIPGRVVQALKQAGAMNPVFMLDEIDKITVGYQGDPAAALLEVLDPSQNHSFRDHYLEINVDLSRVLFIATANQLGTIHPALLDRMELISLAGYTEEEKLHIATRYLIPRQLEENGLRPDAVSFEDNAIRRIVTEYTREAGVRNLERQIGAVARKIAARIASQDGGDPAKGPAAAAAVPAAASRAETQRAWVVTAASLTEYLGPPRFRDEVSFRVSRPGVATGVAWTETGGDVLFIEARLLPSGHQNLILTGQLGNVMQESARAALSHIRAEAAQLGIAPESLDKNDLHVHVPAGAIPKDGPSAGVTMATAMVSALRNQPVRDDVAMTGEITLSGLVLPVGGIREKALAARRHGIKEFVLPARNEPDLAELPAEVKDGIRFIPVQTLEEVLKVALPER